MVIAIRPYSLVDRVLILLACLGAAYCSYLLIFSVLQSEGPSTARIGEMKVEGSVNRRFSRTLHWRSVKGSGSVYLNDYVYVGKDSRAIVNFTSGQTLEIFPETMVYFGDASENSLFVTLYQGRVLGSRQVIVERTATFEAAETLKPIPYLPEISQFEERLEKLTEGVAALESRAIATDAIGELPVAAKLLPIDKVSHYEIRLVAPKSSDTIEISPKGWIELSWTALPQEGVTYLLEISMDESFRRLIKYQTAGRLVRAQVQESGQYFWRVTASKGEEHALSDTETFTVQVAEP